VNGVTAVLIGVLDVDKVRDGVVGVVGGGDGWVSAVDGEVRGTGMFLVDVGVDGLWPTVFA
jgi:hypothetical protein